MAELTSDEYSENDFLTTEELSLFNESLDRVIKCESFLDRFYDRFINSSEQTARIFEGVNMQALQSKLAKTLTLMSLANTEPWRVDEHLKGIGQYHQGLSIPKILYSSWRNSLVSTLHSCDPEFHPEIERVWHKAISVAIKKMHEGYN